MQEPHHLEESILFVVATPIGNLGDISSRAKDVLANADIIAAEDTRHTRKLLQLIGIEGKKLVSCYDHNEADRAEELIGLMQASPIRVALVSDAGTPCISDPGYRVVAQAQQAGIKVSPVPGPSSLVALISASGLPTNRFMFVGFLPQKESQLKKEIASWANVGAPIVFFETGVRIRRTLAHLAGVMPNAAISFGRELTKVYEEIKTTTVIELQSRLENGDRIRGEIVCMLCPPSQEELSEDPQALEDRILAEARRALDAGASHKDLTRKFENCGISRKHLYSLLLTLK